MWQPGVDNTFTRGLIMSFQADHGLIPNGEVDAGLWTSMIGALAANTVNTGGYNYALADKANPQSLTIYHDGVVVLRSLANMGIAGSPTPDGTFPVYTRLRRQVMRGTNPDGRRYADLVQFIAYFNGNDAVHYMDRADYGIPQSLGCVELPLAGRGSRLALSRLRDARNDRQLTPKADRRRSRELDGGAKVQAGHEIDSC